MKRLSEIRVLSKHKSIRLISRLIQTQFFEFENSFGLAARILGNALLHVYVLISCNINPYGSREDSPGQILISFTDDYTR